jgi:hypothetical protein
MEGEKQQTKQRAPWLKQYEWKPGQSGNMNGRPKGKTLKEWAKDFLMSLPDEEKLEFIKDLPPEIVWKMAEGNPDNKNELTGKDGEELKLGIIILPTKNGRNIMEGSTETGTGLN